MAQKVVIVGGGFAGIRAALDLAHKQNSFELILVSDKSHFEYHPSLYRVVTGASPLESCIPLAEIFAGKKVMIKEEMVTAVDLKEKVITCQSGEKIDFDYLVLALGSETAYFNIPGLAEWSFGFKSTYEALQLKKHLVGLFAACRGDLELAERVCLTNIVIIGGGPSGVELAGELAVHTKRLAEKYGVDSNLVTIELLEAAPRLLPTMPPAVSARVTVRLRQLGLNIFVNRALAKEEVDEVYLQDMKLRTKTLIWTAGAKPNGLYAKIDGLVLDKKGRVIVDEHLRPGDFDNVFVAGDGAAVQYSGMAQTARAGGEHIAAALSGRVSSSFKPRQPVYSMPVGPGWAATVIGGMAIYGRLGWWLRRAADLRFFLSILPAAKAWKVFRPGKRLAESCRICLPK